ncbi:MAG: transaldolase family protein [Pseudoflavonifractor sp.]
MKLIIDDGDLEKISRIWDYYPCDGVTTNPSILAKSGQNPYRVLADIRAVIGEKAELHAQVISSTAEEMYREGQVMRDRLGGNFYVKVPVTVEGLKAIRHLAADRVRVTATAVYTPMQAFLGAKAGAAYAAPYVNRIDNLGANGTETVKIIHDMFRSNSLATEVLAASFKNTQQVQELCRYGVGAVTVSADIIDLLIKNPCVSDAVSAFTQAFEGLCGAGKTMADC